MEERLKQHWELLIEGDEVNLNPICQRVHQIDLFHYDSDKSYSGRTSAIATIAPKLSPKQ